MIDTMTTNARRASVLTCQSPAKVNLYLEVLSRRDDGYHDIRSVVLGLDLTDTLSFSLTSDDQIELICDAPGLPTDGRNLVVQAAQQLSGRCTAGGGVRIELSKRIPVAAGLGGGSGNCAATLYALNRLWNLDLADAELSALGASVGSDVPLFFSLPASLISGRGERVEPFTMKWSGWVLLAFAGCEVSTKAVYDAWLSADSGGRSSDPVAAIAPVETATELAGLCRNDLELAVFRVAPRVSALRDAVETLAKRPVRVSGAGQAVFVLYDDQEEAEALRAVLQSRGIGIGLRLVRSMTGPLTIEQE